MVRTVSFPVLVVLVVSVACFSQDALPSSSDRVPVLIELFTSEGCSTCPPADRFVQSLDTQPVPGIEFIVLSEHVDYWDHQGWSDPYSSPDFSERQRVYARQFKLGDVYTPQLVIDGSRQMSGTDAKEAAAAVDQVRTKPKTELRITHLTAGQALLRAHVESDPVRLADVHMLDVYVVIALNHAESQVTRGENANHRLTHTAVARKIKRIGRVTAGERFSQDAELKIDAKIDPRNLRLVAFLQDPDSRRIFGATMKTVAQPQTDSATPRSTSATPTSLNQ
jgi:hypothetical protein